MDQKEGDRRLADAMQWRDGPRRLLDLVVAVAVRAAHVQQGREDLHRDALATPIPIEKVGRGEEDGDGPRSVAAQKATESLESIFNSAGALSLDKPSGAMEPFSSDKPSGATGVFCRCPSIKNYPINGKARGKKRRKVLVSEGVIPKTSQE